MLGRKKSWRNWMKSLEHSPLSILLQVQQIALIEVSIFSLKKTSLFRKKYSNNVSCTVSFIEEALKNDCCLNKLVQSVQYNENIKKLSMYQVYLNGHMLKTIYKCAVSCPLQDCIFMTCVYKLKRHANSSSKKLLTVCKIASCIISHSYLLKA